MSRSEVHSPWMSNRINERAPSKSVAQFLTFEWPKVDVHMCTSMGSSAHPKRQSKHIAYHHSFMGCIELKNDDEDKYPHRLQLFCGSISTPPMCMKSVRLRYSSFNRVYWISNSQPWVDGWFSSFTSWNLRMKKSINVNWIIASNCFTVRTHAQQTMTMCK